MQLLRHILLFVASSLTVLAADDIREAQSDDIRYAVIRYQIDNARLNQKENVKLYYLAVAEKDVPPKREPPPRLPLPLGDKRHDPSEALISRFENHQPPMLKNSALKQHEKSYSKRGVRFRATRIVWKSNDEVEVDGGYDDAWSALWTTFTVRKVDGRWRVLEAEDKHFFIR